MATDYIQKKTHSEIQRWICIYPAYLDKTKTRAEGRRVPLTHAVENPNYQEISEVLGNEGFKLAVENKVYPREKSHELNLRGRIRVQFRNDDGTLIKSNFPTRESIMVYCGEKIPFLKSRTQKDVKAPADQGVQGGKKKGKKK